MSLAGAKVGDKIVCEKKFSHTLELYIVERMTATTAVCGSATFKLSDGLMVGTGGGNGWDRRSGRIATQADLIKVRIQRATRSLADFKVNADNLVAVEALLAAPATPAQGQTK